MTGSVNGAAAVRAKTRPWDPVEYLETAGDAIAYLEAAFEDGDPRVIAAALGDVARRQGMTSVAAKAGHGRESLYKALSRDGNPGFATVLNVIEALGLRLCPLTRNREAVAPATIGETGWTGGFALPPNDLFVLSGESLPAAAQRVSDFR